MGYVLGCDPSEAGRSQVQSHPWLDGEFQVSLDDLRLALKKYV